MKKLTALLLASNILFSMTSCDFMKNFDDLKSTDPDIDITEKFPDTLLSPPTTNIININYDPVLKVYRRIVNSCLIVNQNPLAVAAELGIEDENEKDAFLRLYSSIDMFCSIKSQEYSLSPKLGYGYAQKDLNGDKVDELLLLTDDYKIIAIFSFINGTPMLLANYIDEDSGWLYRNWIDSEGRIHVIRTDGMDIYHHYIDKIYSGQLVNICTYGYDVFRENGEIVGKFYQNIQNNTTFITEQEVQALNRQYQNPLSTEEATHITKESIEVAYTPLYTEAEIAMEMYDAVLKNGVKVCETDIQEYNYLADCRTPYNRIQLRDCGELGYAYTDFDGDSINELVIDCGDTLILRYYEGTVYVYPFTFRNMYQLNTDGSYNWNHTGQDFEYGEDQLAFDGAELKPKEIWRIVNDGEPNAEYYIEGKQVSQEELQKYIGDNQKTKIEFSPLEVSWQKTISLEKALEIASEYWYECYNIKAGDVDSETGFPYAFLPKNSNNENYRIALAWLVEGTHYSTLEMIEIDAFTGEIIVPTYEPDGK